MRKVVLIVLAASGSALLIFILPILMVAMLIPYQANAQGATCRNSNVVLVDPELSAEQLRIAGIIIAKTAEVSAAEALYLQDTHRAEWIAVAVGYGESSLTNVDHGDAAGPDSIGVYQQRDPWGTLAQRTDPAEATALFLTADKGSGVTGLLRIDGWQQMSLTAAAHAVQNNADPNYYEQFELMASKLVVQANAGAEPPMLVGCRVGDLQVPPNIGGPDSRGYYTMPPSLDGAYTIYSTPVCRTGSLELISVLYTVAQAWKANHADGWINIGDLNAGYPHNSHKWGVGVDLDATTNGSDWVADYTRGNYNQAATIELGQMFVDTGKIKNIWYGDSSVNTAVLAYARENDLPLAQMKIISGHQNHYHIDVTTPPGPLYAPTC